jgi:hypothetical protein
MKELHRFAINGGPKHFVDFRLRQKVDDSVEDQDCPECDGGRIFDGVDEQDCPTCGGAASVNEGAEA